MSKLISTFKIGFDDETKAVLSELKDMLDAITGTLGVPSALLGTTKPTGGLLVAMSNAANDAPQPELENMGQWVFEGQDEKWVSAAKDANNEVWLFQVPIKDLARNENDGHLLWYAQDGSKATYLCDLRSNEDWKNSAIDRETINDVDYLSGGDLDECVPHIDEVLDQHHWLSESVPQITQADMQLIFIKNLSECLIQRMHSMDRFSEDDYAIGGDKLMAWDIVFNDLGNEFGIVTGFNKYHQMMVSFFKQCTNGQTMTGSLNFHLTTMIGKNLRTITEAELPAFRAALEACYA